MSDKFSSEHLRSSMESNNGLQCSTIFRVMTHHHKLETNGMERGSLTHKKMADHGHIESYLQYNASARGHGVAPLKTNTRDKL